MPDELIVLGSASSIPTKRRFSSAYALKVASKLFLIDCGAPVSTLLYHHQLDPVEVRSLFLSHWHMDHIANLGLLISQNHHRKRTRALNIYGPKGTRGKIRRLLLDSFMLPAALNYRLKVTNVKPGKLYKESLLRVTFFKTRHLEIARLKTQFGNKATACGMIIQGPGWRVVYSGDLASPTELGPYVQGCDLLIHEMAHHRPEEIAEFAAAAKIPHLLISHIDPEFDETPEKIEAAFANRYSGDLIVASDGTKVRLSQIRKNSSIEFDPLINPDLENSRSRSFFQILRQEFNFSRQISEELLQRAKEVLVTPAVSTLLPPGQTRLAVSRLRSSTQSKQKTIEVTLTLDAGADDVFVKERERAFGLRRGRIIRLLEEAIEQGGILTITDLAHLLSADLRTIKRDIEVLESEGHQIYLQDKPAYHKPGLSYKARAVEMWLDGMEIDQISKWLHHSPRAVQQYIDNFLAVVTLHDKTPGDEIARLSQLPGRLVEDYRQIQQAASDHPSRSSNLEAALAQQP